MFGDWQFIVILPPIIAIVLALVTKEVYSSLIVGVLVGVVLCAFGGIVGGDPISVLTEFYNIVFDSASNGMKILTFLVLLGILVVLVTKAGGAKAYGNWAALKIRSQKGAMLATSGLGALIFVDDYFNCLTVGAVMRPVTDKYKISRAKLAYIIDSTAAPICIIAPISSWAISVAGTEGVGGMGTFLATIPFNMYALLTIAMVVVVCVTKFDFAAMRKIDRVASEEGFDEKVNDVDTHSFGKVRGGGKVIDLLIPIGTLIVLSILAMMYTGGLFEGKDIITAFGECDANMSLILGATGAILVTMVLYLSRGILTFTQFASSITDGFKSMVPAITILIFAWSLSAVCGSDYLNIGEYIGYLVETSQMTLTILPAIVFVIAVGLAFSTGTSWGTFGILVPIVATIITFNPDLLVITIAATLAGAVCGDHISPISDTTILASAGAECNHIDHVRTQIPYALTVAVASFIGFIAAGLASPLGYGVALVITWAVSIIVFVTELFVLSSYQKRQLTKVEA